ncbi:hypothetical protein Dimus_022604 [Dionaea muscipula]
MWRSHLGSYCSRSVVVLETTSWWFGWRQLVFVRVLKHLNSSTDHQEFIAKLEGVNSFESKPLKGLRVGIILETIGDGVDQTVISSINAVAAHLEDLGCSLVEVSLPSFSLGLLAYYILDASESSSNLSCCDGIRSDFFKCATTE